MRYQIGTFQYVLVNALKHARDKEDIMHTLDVFGDFYKSNYDRDELSNYYSQHPLSYIALIRANKLLWKKLVFTEYTKADTDLYLKFVTLFQDFEPDHSIILQTVNASDPDRYMDFDIDIKHTSEVFNYINN